MAVLFSDSDSINKAKLSKGKITFLEFLAQNLNQEYELYVNPFFSGDKPDIVILKKRGGVIIITVFERKLNDYYTDENTQWHLVHDDKKIKSPLEKIKTYKDNMYALHIEGLQQKSLQNRNYRDIINTVIFFPDEEEKDIINFLTNKFNDEQYNGYKAFIKYIEYLGKDSLNKQSLNNLLIKTGISLKNDLFDDVLYKNFRRYLQAAVHKSNEGRKIIYSREKQELIKSEISPRRKIKGLAGGGKTFVLAKRAVNAYLRTKGKILILCFNLSLKNLIRERIHEIRERFPSDAFYISNYKQFFNAASNNHNLYIEDSRSYSNINFFDHVEKDIEKYTAIFIDEVQDYKTEWLEIITKYFLEENGEFVVFGDEKQNTFNRPLDELKEPVIKTIRGIWNKSLIVSKRFTNKIGRLALMYQKELMAKKYTVDETEIIDNPTLDFKNEVLAYSNLGPEANARDLYQTYKNLISSKINAKNVTILAPKVKILREIDYYIRSESGGITKTTFESEEYYEKLKFDFPREKDFKNHINTLRLNKINHFYMTPGRTKLSTIRSFKGWESHTVLLIIENESEESSINENLELYYTGITRAKKNLFIINLGNQFYDTFFRIKADQIL